MTQRAGHRAPRSAPCSWSLLWRDAGSRLAVPSWASFRWAVAGRGERVRRVADLDGLWPFFLLSVTSDSTAWSSASVAQRWDQILDVHEDVCALRLPDEAVPSLRVGTTSQSLVPRSPPSITSAAASCLVVPAAHASASARRATASLYALCHNQGETQGPRPEGYRKNGSPEVAMPANLLPVLRRSYGLRTTMARRAVAGTVGEKSSVRGGCRDHGRS